MTAFRISLASRPTDASTTFENFELLRMDGRHPGLHFKKAGGYWSVRVGRNYRALGKAVENGILWVWIGSHDEYLRLLYA